MSPKRVNADGSVTFYAYWYMFNATGVEEIDTLLSILADAGKAAHSTEFWGGQDDKDMDRNYINEIQQWANDLAKKLRELENIHLHGRPLK